MLNGVAITMPAKQGCRDAWWHSRECIGASLCYDHGIRMPYPARMACGCELLDVVAPDAVEEFTRRYDLGEMSR